MEFHVKLQELRKQKGLTQEELAQALFVSRTAVSKWESARGYPSIDSLKALAKFFGVTVDQLLSGDQLLTMAEEDTRQKQNHFCDLVFGLLDAGVALFFFLPLFGQESGGTLREVSLLGLTEIAAYLRLAYLAAVIGIVLLGIATLALQNCRNGFWQKHKRLLSLGFNGAGVLLFIISQQPYGAALLFLFLGIKIFILAKRQ